MKKLIAMISAIAVIGTMSLTSFAEITVASNAEVTGTYLAKGATSGYDASYTSDKVNTQTTIVAVKGTEINTSSIQYINQLTQDSETVINFDLKDTLNAGETVTVYMGGDAIDKTKIGTIAEAAAVQKFTVTFKVGDTANATEYNEGADITLPADPTKEADAEYTYTFAGWYVEGDETQTVVDLTGAKATATITYVAKFTATPIQSGGETVTISYQLVNVDITSTTVDSVVGTATLNSGDVIYTSMTEPTLSKYAFVGWYTDSALTTKLDKTATATVDTTIYAKMVKLYKLGDVDLDNRGRVNNADLNALFNWIADKTTNDRINVTEIPGTGKKLGDVDLDNRGRVNNADLNALFGWIADNSSNALINTDIQVVKD